MSDEELENNHADVIRKYEQDFDAGLLELKRTLLKKHRASFRKVAVKEFKEEIQKKNKKRDREDDSKPVVVPLTTPVAKPEAVESTKKEEEEWTCAGRVWENPPIPCQGGPKSNEKAGIQINGENGGKRKNITVCKTCKLAKQKAARNKNKKNKNE